MRPVLPVMAAIFCLSAQTPDPFTGTWRLNPERSTFPVAGERYVAGTRTYAPTAKGTRVSWSITDTAGKTQAGKYAVVCKNGHCLSDDTYWKVQAERAVEGETFTKGVLDHRFTRTVSADGRTLTITFYVQGKSEPSSIQVWEKSGK